MNLILVPGLWLGAWSWDFFRQGGDDRDLRDMSDEMLADLRARAVPEPWGVANDPLPVSNPAELDVPMTMISSTFSREEIDDAIENHVPYFAEVTRIRNLEIKELPTGHWPQLSKPYELAQQILAAL